MYYVLKLFRLLTTYPCNVTILATHCKGLIEPPDHTGLRYVPFAETNHLVLQSGILELQNSIFDIYKTLFDVLTYLITYQTNFRVCSILSWGGKWYIKRMAPPCSRGLFIWRRCIHLRRITNTWFSDNTKSVHGWLRRRGFWLLWT